MNGIERILTRAIHEARTGQTNPHTCVMHATDVEHGDTPQDSLRAFLAARDAAGEPLVRWYEGRRRKPVDTVALLEEALFRVQMGS
jgi:hypothetical protein